MSTFSVEVVPVVLEPHPNADSLSIVKVGGYQVVVRTNEWQEADRGAYIPPDSIVPDEDVWKWLGKTDTATGEVVLRDKDRRITARRFRGEWSFGLLVPSTAPIGENVADALGITHYEPPVNIPEFGRGQGGLYDFIEGPSFPGPFYDIENLRRYPNLIEEGEEVIITEKLHGANIRITYQQGKLWVASRKHWRSRYLKYRPKGLFSWIKEIIHRIRLGHATFISNPSQYWAAVDSDPELRATVVMHPGFVFYGEIYGTVQNGFPYDATTENKIRIFDVYDPQRGEFVTEEIWNNINSDLLVPVDYRGPFSRAIAEEIAMRPSQLGKHVREGCVIKLKNERRDPVIGRVILKEVNPRYLEKS